MRTVALPQGALRIRDTGAHPSGRTLVLMADPPNVLEMYGTLVVALKPHARVVVFEAMGFGQSRPARDHAHDLDAAAHVVISLLEALDVRRATLALPCLGAYVSLRVARLRPDLVDGIVAMQAPSWHDERDWIARIDRRGVLRAPLVGPIVGYLRAEAIARAWYRAAHAQRDQAERFGALAIESFDHGARFPLAAALRAAMRAPDPPTTDVPTLLVWGAKDRSHRESAPAGFRDHAPGARLVVLDDAGHFPELEQPRRFTDELVAWWKESVEK